MILVTGGTGAIGRHLVPALASDPACFIVVLARNPGSEQARALVAAAGGRVRVAAGDVTAGAVLGLSASEGALLRETVTGIVHCAANTSFTAPLGEARATNVGGTGAVLDFARSCPRLDRMICASTAYVAGRRTGRILETDTAAPAHVNVYEQSKHEMEALVRQAMRNVPVSIARLSTIIGRAGTGSVDAFNAIHHALRLFYRGLAPMVPGTLETPVDLIPMEFAAGAIAHIMLNACEPSTTYHLCAGGARSSTLDALLDASVDAFQRARPAWRKRRIERPAVVDEATYALFVRSVEESGNETLIHATRSVQAFAGQLACPKTFDTTNAARALAGSGIEVPPVLDYFDKVVAYCVESNWGGRALTDPGSP